MIHTLQTSRDEICVIDDAPLGVEIQHRTGFLILSAREADALAHELKRAAARRRSRDASAPPYVGLITNGQPGPGGLVDAVSPGRATGDL